MPSHHTLVQLMPWHHIDAVHALASYWHRQWQRTIPCIRTGNFSFSSNKVWLPRNLLAAGQAPPVNEASPDTPITPYIQRPHSWDSNYMVHTAYMITRGLFLQDVYVIISPRFYQQFLYENLVKRFNMNMSSYPYKTILCPQWDFLYNKMMYVWVCTIT